MRKLERQPALRQPPMFEDKAPRRAEADRGDHRPAAEFALVVAMPTHRIPAIPVQIGQHRIELLAGNRAHAIAERGEHRRPGPWLEAHAGIDVTRPGIANPAAQPRRIDQATEQSDPMDFPVDAGVRWLE